MLFNIVENQQLTSSVYKMTLSGDVSAIKRAGQFVNVQIEGLYLRRPVSVCDFSENSLTLIYKVVGVGTKKMSLMQAGESLDLLVGLGNGFEVNVETEKPLLIGGGAGVPPLYALAKSLLKAGKKPTVILCFNTKNEIFLYTEFKNLGIDAFIATIDGSAGVKGFFSDVIKTQNIDFDYYFTCAPLPMLKAVYQQLTPSGQLSFEERMGCGFGGCMGCTHKTKNGYKKVCTDTVLKKEEVLFD
ncbi:MAG: dihydroorotate dehydrogenase electron transfer subunit [Prevotellaceae bacterium]|jgi:dihydroorotate dehydrogenase electron transfer subunit|nr:dihydroorotate dehydrogenase electron transfer subunit [Prevotellaceae bacterium]